LAAALLGALAGAFFRGVFDPEPSRTAENFGRSIASGLVIALAMAGAHLWLTRVAAPWLRRRSLAVEILVDGGVMAGAGTAAQIAVQSVFYGVTPADMPALIPFHMAFALTLAILFLAAIHVVRLVGPQRVLRVLAGRYRRPVEETRVFLFIDLKEATALAESLGPIRVADLIARFFRDVDDVIVDHGGEVHAYIGDEVIVTWPLETVAGNAACLFCVTAIRGRITDLTACYAAEFGVVPDFRAVLHCGPVVVSEIGHSKQQLGYFGDTINVAARLEDHAKRIGQDFLASRDVIGRIGLPANYAATDLGDTKLKGREATVSVVALTRTGQPAVSGCIKQG
jgi:class 3 adenylate cyclase